MTPRKRQESRLAACTCDCFSIFSAIRMPKNDLTRYSCCRRQLLSQTPLYGDVPTPTYVARSEQFFFLDSGSEDTAAEGSSGSGEGGSGSNGEVTRGMAMLMRAMEREEHGAGTSLMEQARSQYSNDPSIVPACGSQHYRHYSGNRHHLVYCVLK